MAYASLKKAKKINRSKSKSSQPFSLYEFLKDWGKLLIYGLFFIAICIESSLCEKLIGTDDRYLIYIITIPTIAIFLVLVLISKSFFYDFFEEQMGIFSRLIYSVIILCGGLILSACITVFTVDIAWNVWMQKTAENSKLETFHCDIGRFWKGARKSSPSFEYYFQNSYEEIKVKYETIEPYLDKNPDDYELIVTVRKTAWDYYILENWWVEKREKF